jgi:hypothetical protein
MMVGRKSPVKVGVVTFCRKRSKKSGRQWAKLQENCAAKSVKIV